MNKRRKSIAIALACAMLVGTIATTVAVPCGDMSFGMTVSAADIVKSGSCGENVTYTLDSEGTLTISGTGEMEEYAYDESPFFENYDIKKVIIENGVTSIGENAFRGCETLTDITIPDSVTSIGGSAFCDCTSLTSITIPDSVTSIGGGAFAHCTSLTDITIPDSVTSIGESAFWGCTSLTDITIPDSVTSIGGTAFAGCTSLTSITIPDSVTSIGDGAFVETLWYENQPDGLVYAGKLAYGYKGEIPENTLITLEEGTTGIADYAFWGCTSLTDITLPDSVTSIGDGAFRGCTSLTSINIPDSVTSIGGGAFAGTLWYENQPDGLVYAGKVAYGYKGEMPENTPITLEEGTTGIADYAFWGCTSLTDITIPDSVTSIGYYAFEDCSSLKSITIPDSVTSIGKRALGYNYDTDSWEYVKQPDFTITGYDGTEAERYAKDNGFEFISLGEVPVPSGLLGDVNDDGSVDIADSLFVARADAGLATLTDAQKQAADVNKDGSADIADALFIARVDAGLASL